MESISKPLIGFLLLFFLSSLQGFIRSWDKLERCVGRRFYSQADDEVFTEGVVYKKTLKSKKPTDNRDQLPFQIFSNPDGPPHQPMELGTFLLDSSTGCGDYVDLGVRGMYKVRSVTFRYKFNEGKFNVISKKLDVIPIQDNSHALYDRSLLQSHSVYDILQ